MATTFDFETALKQLQSGQALTGENGILTPLIKQLTEAALEQKSRITLKRIRNKVIAAMAILARQ